MAPTCAARKEHLVPFALWPGSSTVRGLAHTFPPYSVVKFYSFIFILGSVSTCSANPSLVSSPSSLTLTSTLSAARSCCHDVFLSGLSQHCCAPGEQGPCLFHDCSSQGPSKQPSINTFWMYLVSPKWPREDQRSQSYRLTLFSNSPKWHFGMSISLLKPHLRVEALMCFQFPVHLPTYPGKSVIFLPGVLNNHHCVTQRIRTRALESDCLDSQPRSLLRSSLCDLVQITKLFWALVSSSEKRV